MSPPGRNSSIVYQEIISVLVKHVPCCNGFYYVPRKCAPVLVRQGLSSDERTAVMHICGQAPRVHIGYVFHLF